MNNSQTYQRYWIYFLLVATSVYPNIGSAEPEFLTKQQSSSLWGFIGSSYLIIGILVLWFTIRTWQKIQKLEKELTAVRWTSSNKENSSVN